MTPVDFWFDPVSPYAYLAFEQLPQSFAGLSIAVSYRPVLFAAMLAHHAHKGPAEIEPKRAWTFRRVHWLADRMGVEMATPKRHPFNPLALLRLAWAAAPAGSTPGRYVCEQVLHHVWRGGEDAEEPGRIMALRASLAPRDAQGDDVKQRLRAETDAAIARGVFGVPTIGVGDRLFWGHDALDMAAACVARDPWFERTTWDVEGRPREGVVR